MTTPDSDGLLAEQLLRLTRRVHRIQKRHLEQRGLGVTPAQARLLRTLAHCDAPPRMADLAERLEVVPRAVTTLVDALEASGKVRRVPDPTNRRVIRIELTEDGGEALRELRGARVSAAKEILDPLTDLERQVLSGLLDALVDGTPERERTQGQEQGRGHEQGQGQGRAC
ncbi:MarR family winged helix-turn-helix transcriptional regulator [Streptomyces sp. 3214.6]|uniref:MarR family winged helix-turn-helix transcriptional regulator n=1 Tax=Streptomyces sp. 3214.6 TaxID=1882757 RepID=UPI00090BB031|nr:MarR family transcriptional regulator [Streptomyces sp. 3214.6]SHI61109.1 DNA-binding transcriptional regulator, MarR family [Streptomyces sp. 3214.6]